MGIVQSEKEDSDFAYAAHRKRMKQMLFLYMALLDGWQIKMLAPKQFHMTRVTRVHAT